MTPQERKVMEQALEALNKLTDVFLDTEGNHGDYEQKALNQGNKAIDAIEEALAQPGQEPLTENGMYRLGYHNSYGFGEAYGKANAPQRTWVGLTDREINELWISLHDDFGNPPSATGYERAIEAKLKNKNTRGQE